MPYKNEPYKPYNIPKGQTDTFKGTMEEVSSFYNNYPNKIKASNIFPELANGSTTGRYTIIVFFDK